MRLQPDPAPSSRLLAPLALCALLLALTPPAPASGDPLAAGGDHAGEDHSNEVHAGEDLHGIDLSGADLSISDLSGSLLADANLEGADLTGAVLDGADLSAARLVGADLSGASLMGVDAPLLDATGADFSDAWLCGAQLAGSHFADADLSRASLVGADLSGVTGLEDADLDGAYFDTDTLLPEGLDPEALEMVEVMGACPWDAELAHVDTDADHVGDDCHATPLPEPGRCLGLSASLALTSLLASRRRTLD